MKTPLQQDNWPSGISASLFLAALLLFPWAVPIVSAAPRPLAPPWPSFGIIHRENFDEPLGFATNQVVDPVVWAESWSGWNLNRQGTTVTPWVVPMVGANSFRVEPERGAIRLWYRPDFSNGTGPGQPATLLTLATIKDKTELVWWTLVVTPDGTEVHLVCQTEKGAESCLSAPVNWTNATWHLVTLGFTPTNSALFIDDQLAAAGPGLTAIPNEVAPYTSLIVGSSVSGALPAQGQIEELAVFSGRKPMPQVMGNSFGLSVDWEIGAYYHALAKIAALGPVSEAELAARAAWAEQRRLEREALGLEWAGGGMEMLRLGGPVANCATNSPLFITNTMAWFDTNALWTVQFEIQGTNALGATGGPVDIFGTTNLSGTNWFFLERGPSCSRFEYTNQSAVMTFYLLGDATIDPDGDGMSTAYETLVAHGNPLVYERLDTDGDGLSDAWELAQGTNPTRADSDGNGIPDGAEDYDGDGLANLLEAVFGGNPVVFNLNWRQDADGDGIPDSIDASPGTPDAPPFVTTFDKCPLP